LPLLYLVRHGQTDWNAEHRLQGRADRPLNATGQLQAAAVAQRLASEPLEAIYSSDLARAMATAQAIAARHHLTVTLEPRLREISYGTWEGRTMAEIAQRYPSTLEAWRHGGYVPEEMGGEPEPAVASRVSALLEELANRPSEERIALVSHGACLRVLIALLAGGEAAARRPVVGTASLSRVLLTPSGARILSLDERAHLEKVHAAEEAAAGA